MFHVKPRPWMTRVTDHDRFLREVLCRERNGFRRVNVEGQTMLATGVRICFT
jgi:hypothetical protein